MINHHHHRHHRHISINLIFLSFSSSPFIPSKTDTFEQNETYTLQLGGQNNSLEAETVFGAMRGLETLSQLIMWNVSNAQNGEESGEKIAERVNDIVEGVIERDIFLGMKAKSPENHIFVRKKTKF